MYAVFESGGFQFNAEEGSRLKVPKIDAKSGDVVALDKVLLIKDGDNSHIGNPYLESAKVEAEIIGDGREDKVLVFKKKRRTKYRKTHGHRQDYTEIEIKKIIPPAG